MNFKRKVSLILTLVIMLSTFTSAFAITGDLTVIKSGDTIMVSEWTLDQVLQGRVTLEPGEYEIEVAGKNYKLDKIFNIMLNDESLELADAAAIIDAETPTGELKVVDVSAINKTTIKVTFDNGDVENFKVAPLTNGENTRTIVYKGSSYTVEVDFSDVPGVDKAEVESVVLNNYRRMTVTFNTVVDKHSAEDPANYYFELVDGQAGKLGANVEDSYSLNDISGIGNWWTSVAGNISAKSENGKTVVTINFPHDARFDDSLTIIDTGVIVLKDLVEDTNFLFAVRDVKDSSGTKTIDTSVKEILVKDTVKPVLETDLGTLKVKSDATIGLEFDEPMETSTTNVKLYVDGVVNTTPGAITITETVSYEDSKVAELDLTKTVVVNGSVGDVFTVLITGLRDLAGNLANDVKFNVEVTEDATSTEDLKILGVEQVLDNVFRVEANKAATSETIDLTVKKADFDNGDVKQNASVDFKEYVYPNGKKSGRYFAYVGVKAIHKATVASEGVDFKAGFYLTKDIVVEGRFDTFIEKNMHIEIDRQAPILDGEVINHTTNFIASAVSPLKIGFTDVNPSNWAETLLETEIADAQDAIFENNARGYAASVLGEIRVKLQYTKANGEEVNKYVDLDYGNTDAKINNNTLELDVTTLTNGANFDQGATFEVSFPKGVASDDYLGNVTGLTLVKGSTAQFLDTSGRVNDTSTDEHGYTSLAGNVVINIPESIEGGKKVPQTSKKLIGYDAASKEIVILITGLPTRDSVEDLNNYVLNGETLRELGAKKADVFFADAQADDVNATKVVGIATGLNVADYKVIRIALPKGSVEKNGPADFIVRNLAHKDGAVMAEVESVVEGLEDNTAPSFVSGKIEGNQKITLKFDEGVELVADASNTSATRNFTVRINGKEAQVISVEADGSSVITLEIANDSEVIQKAEIGIKINANGKMELADDVGNELEVTTTPIVINK